MTNWTWGVPYKPFFNFLKFFYQWVWNDSQKYKIGNFRNSNCFKDNYLFFLTRAFYCSKNEVLVVCFLLYQAIVFYFVSAIVWKMNTWNLIVPVVKWMDFKLQIASRISFRKPSPAISHILKFAFRPKNREKTLNVSIRFLADNKSLRKKVESSAKAVYKKG